MEKEKEEVDKIIEKLEEMEKKLEEVKKQQKALQEAFYKIYEDQRRRERTL